MAESFNDHDHKMNEPWQTLGKIRDDLKQARAVLQMSHNSPVANMALEHVNRALARVGDGSRDEGGAA